MVGAIASRRSLSLRPDRFFGEMATLIWRSHTFFRCAASRLPLATRFFAIAWARDLFSGVQFSTAIWVCAAACAQLQLLGESRGLRRAIAWSRAPAWAVHLNAWAGFVTNTLIKGNQNQPPLDMMQGDPRLGELVLQRYRVTKKRHDQHGPLVYPPSGVG